MKTIIHVVDVAVPPKDVYAAATTQAGLSGWWSTKVTAEPVEGSVVDFTFLEGFNPQMKIEKLDEPSVVAWRCVAGHEPWADNTFRFDIAERDGGTRLVFRQEYTQELTDEHYGVYNFNWGYYLESLRLFCETGTGKPYPATED